jgi:hypothetical protein
MTALRWMLFGVTTGLAACATRAPSQPIFFKTVWIMQIDHPPVCREMLRRFRFELAGGGHYEPPPFYRDGDPRVI